MRYVQCAMCGGRCAVSDVAVPMGAICEEPPCAFRRALPACAAWDKTVALAINILSSSVFICEAVSDR